MDEVIENANDLYNTKEVVIDILVDKEKTEDDQMFKEKLKANQILIGCLKKNSKKDMESFISSIENIKENMKKGKIKTDIKKHS